jgi:hypothetical protein
MGPGTLACILSVVLLPAAAAAGAGEPVPRELGWGFGWDDGLTLRRWVGGWELGVAAGPEDWLRDEDSRQWDTAEADSLQGRDYRDDSYHRESGFVRLQAGRRLDRRGPLEFLVHANLQYRWRDERWEHVRYYTDRIVEDSTDAWTETWSASAAARLAWRPLDTLSIETAFGLTYSWSEQERVYRDVERDLVEPIDPDREVVRQYKESTRSFDDYGWSGFGSLSFIYWF